MRVSLTGSGDLSGEYQKINPLANSYSFRSLSDGEIGQILSNTDVLIHNSAGLKDYNSSSNIILTRRIVRLASKYKPKIRFINIGSMSFLNESGYLPIEKMTPYAYSKYISEAYCFAKLSNITSIRFSTLFYRNPKKDILSKLINDAVFKREIILINEGKSKRDFLPINKAVEEIHKIINQTDVTTTIASGVETTFLQIALIIQKFTDCRIEFIDGTESLVLSTFANKIGVNLEKEIGDYIKYLKFL